MIFTGRRKAGRLDLEAVELAVRSAMHRAGDAALTALLQFPVPAADQRTVDCGCGRHARYQELRSKPILTAVGLVHISRPYYWCGHCHTGQFPIDVELDIADTESSPGVRRMLALVGQEVPFDHGRQQMKPPVVTAQPVPILYIQMDGTGIPVVKKETVGRQGKIDGQPAHTREAKLGCVFTQTTWDKE